MDDETEAPLDTLEAVQPDDDEDLGDGMTSATTPAVTTITFSQPIRSAR